MLEVTRKLIKFSQRSEVRSFIFMFSNFAVFVLAFFINVILTNNCSNSEVYGQFKYSTNFILTVPAIFSLGINWSCATLVSKNETLHKQRIITASVISIVILSLVVSTILLLASLVLPTFGVLALTDVQGVLPFVVIFMLQVLVNQVYSGLGEIFQLSIFNLIPNVFIIIGMLLLIVTNGNLSYSQAIILFLVGNTFSILPKLIYLKYDFRNMRQSFHVLFQDVKNSGIMVYISSIFTTSAAQIIALASGQIFGYVEYAYYSLAASLAIVFQMIGSTVAIVNFKKYSNRDRIDNKDILFMIAIGGVAYLVMSLLIDKIFFWFYPQEYAPTINYLRILCFANMIYGFAALFNRFFIGKGLGSIVMKNSIIVAIVNITFSIPLIALFEIKGLVVSSVFASVACVILYIIDYRKWINHRKVDIMRGDKSEN